MDSACIARSIHGHFEGQQGQGCQYELREPRGTEPVLVDATWAWDDLHPRLVRQEQVTISARSTLQDGHGSVVDAEDTQEPAQMAEDAPKGQALVVDGCADGMQQETHNTQNTEDAMPKMKGAAPPAALKIRLCP